MSFLKSYPVTSIFIATLIFALIAGWVLWRRVSRPGTNPKTVARFGYAGGVLLIVIGLIQTGMNIAQGRWNFDFSVVMGLLLCWFAQSIHRAAPNSSQMGKAEPPSVPQR